MVLLRLCGLLVFASAACLLWRHGRDMVTLGISSANVWQFDREGPEFSRLEAVLARPPHASLGEARRIAAQYPQSAAAWHNLGTVLSLQRRTAEARSAYRVALQIDGSYRRAADAFQRVDAPR